MHDITEDCQSGSCDLLGFPQHLGQPRESPMTATLLLTLYTVAKVPFIRDKSPSQLSSCCLPAGACRSLPLLLSINHSAKLSVCLSNTCCGLSPTTKVPLAQNYYQCSLSFKVLLDCVELYTHPREATSSMDFSVVNSVSLPFPITCG